MTGPVVAMTDAGQAAFSRLRQLFAADLKGEAHKAALTELGKIQKNYPAVEQIRGDTAHRPTEDTAVMFSRAKEIIHQSVSLTRLWDKNQIPNTKGSIELYVPSEGATGEQSRSAQKKAAGLESSGSGSRSRREGKGHLSSSSSSSLGNKQRASSSFTR